MEIELIYLIKTFLLPPSSLLFTAFLGAYCVHKDIHKGWMLLIASLFFLVILSLPIVAVSLGKIYKKPPVINLAHLDNTHPQAIIVLGGGISSSAAEYDVAETINSATLLRIRYAAYLVKKIPLPILLSGGKVFNSAENAEASLMKQVFENEFHTGVQWIETASKNTAENAIFSRKILEKEQIDRIILVTHALHMPRAMRQFKKVGFQVTPAPTAFISMSGFSLYNFLPSARALKLSSLVLHECLGQLWYRLRY